MKLRFLALFALVVTLFSCDREYYVDDPQGTWQMGDVMISMRSPMGETIEATSLKELASGVLQVVKKYMPEEDFTEAETFVSEMGDTPFTFTEDQTFRFRFNKDDTFQTFIKNDKGEWETDGVLGEYSYAGSKLTLYSDNEDGGSTTVPCTVVRLTNKKLIMQMKVVNLLDLPGGSPLESGLQSDGEGDDSSAMIMSMLGFIDLTTELSFDKIK